MLGGPGQPAHSHWLANHRSDNITQETIGMTKLAHKAVTTLTLKPRMKNISSKIMTTLRHGTGITGVTTGYLSLIHI